MQYHIDFITVEVNDHFLWVHMDHIGMRQCAKYGRSDIIRQRAVHIFVGMPRDANNLFFIFSHITY